MKPEEKSVLAPEDLMHAFDEVDKLLEQIKAKEDEALRRVYTRFCWLRGLAIDFSKVRRKKYVTNPNIWEYFYMYGTKEQALLLKRELIVTTTEDIPEYKLNIVFNPELLQE